LSNLEMFAKVTFRAEGWHCWPNAPAPREYLRAEHRHLFYVEVIMHVHHSEREVEYHNLLDLAKKYFPGGRMGSLSCENMACAIAEQVKQQFPGRKIEVSVSEDGECGAIVACMP